MAPQAVLYVNTERTGSEEQPSILPCPLAQLIACRIYTCARGFDVKGVHVNWNADPDASMPTLRALLDQLMPNDCPGADSAIQCVVVYDRAAVRLSPSDKIENLLGRHDVQVESVLPPHILPSADTPHDRAFRMFLRGLYGQPTREGAPRDLVFDDTAGVPSWDPLMWPALWASLLDVLGSKSGVLTAMEQGIQPDHSRSCRLADLASKLEREAGLQEEWEGILDLMLDGVIDGKEAARRADLQRAKAVALAVELRRARALAYTVRITPDTEQLAAEIAGGLRHALDGLSAIEQRRAAQLLDLRMQVVPASDRREIECSCLLPLTDEVEREQGKPKQRRRISKKPVPPDGHDNLASSVTDCVLAWTIQLLPER